MIYQAELIEDSSWCIFAEHFQRFHIHSLMWNSISSYGGWIKFIWWLIKSNSL